MTENAFECRLVSGAEVPEEDRTLVADARTEADAAGRLFDKYYGRIAGYIYHCTLDRTATEDLAANVFLAAFRHLGRFRWRRVPFDAWLYRIATNEVRMYYRRRKCAAAVDRRQRSRGPKTDVPPASAGPATAEEYRLLHEALLELKPKYHTVIVLRYFEDKAVGEIAALTGAREGTIKSQLHRGLAQLQEILTRWGVLPE